MFLIAILLKWVLVLACFVGGAALLMTGLGAQVTALKYWGVEVYGIPAGIAVMVVGLALAWFWRITMSSKTIVVHEPTLAQTDQPNIGQTMGLIKTTMTTERLVTASADHLKHKLKDPSRYEA